MQLKTFRRVFLVMVLMSLGVGLFAQVQRLVKTYDGPANGLDMGESIVYGPDGNLYVAGYPVGYDHEDFTIISLDTTQFNIGGELC